MKRGVGRSQRWVVAMVALAGVVAGHVAEYVLIAPDHHERQELLGRTGHQHLPAVFNAGVFVAMVGLALVFVLAFRRGLGRADDRGAPVRWSLALPAAQMLAFAALEVGERLVAHASLADVGLVLVAGLPLQAVVGLFASRLVAVLERIGERLGSSVRDGVPTGRGGRAPSWRALSWLCPRVNSSGAPLPARGPPSLLFSA